MAVENTTSGYCFPAGGEAGGGGLVDVSAAAPEHATHATPDMQQQVQDFFARREAAHTAEGRGQGAAEAQEQAPPADEGTGQG